MALIKKQIFRPSKDENLQQFLAKGDKGYMSLAEQADLSPEEIREWAENDPNQQPRRKKAVKSEPKSPWDDESDALAQKAFEVEDREFQKGKSTSKPTRSDRRLDEEKNRPDLEGTTDDLLGQSSSNRKERMILDQGSDNSNTADDSTQKEYVEKGVVQALTGGRVRVETKPEKKLQPEKSKGGVEVQWGKRAKQDIGSREQAAAKGLHYASKAVQDGVWDAWLEKRGPVDRLTGGRVKFEANPQKQTGSSAGKGGWQMQTTGSPGSLQHKLNRALSGGGTKRTPSTAKDQTKRNVESAGLEYAAKSVGGAVWDAWFEKARTKEQQSAGLKRQTPRMDKPGTPLVGSPNPQGDPWEIRDRRKELDDSIETSRQKPKEEASNSPPSMAAGGGGGNNPPKPPKRPPRKQFRPESDNPSDKYPKPDYSKYAE